MKKKKDFIKEIYNREDETANLSLELSEPFVNAEIEEIQNIEIDEIDLQEEDLDTIFNNYIEKYKGFVECDRPLFFFKIQGNNTIYSGIPLARLNKDYIIWKINNHTKKIKTIDINLEKEFKELNDDFNYNSFTEYFNNFCEMINEDLIDWDINDLSIVIEEQWNSELKKGYDEAKEPIQIYKELKNFILRSLEQNI